MGDQERNRFLPSNVSSLVGAFDICPNNNNNNNNNNNTKFIVVNAMRKGHQECYVQKAHSLLSFHENLSTKQTRLYALLSDYHLEQKPWDLQYNGETDITQQSHQCMYNCRLTWILCWQAHGFMRAFEKEVWKTGRSGSPARQRKDGRDWLWVECGGNILDGAHLKWVLGPSHTEGSSHERDLLQLLIFQSHVRSHP